VGLTVILSIIQSNFFPSIKVDQVFGLAYGRPNCLGLCAGVWESSTAGHGDGAKSNAKVMRGIRFRFILSYCLDREL